MLKFDGSQMKRFVVFKIGDWFAYYCQVWIMCSL